MNRDEWNDLMATERITRNQRGAIMREFDRLGFHYKRDRADRLAVCAALLGIDGLDSTDDLTQGQAGQLVNALQRTATRAELPRIVTAPVADGTQPAVEHQGQDQGHVDDPAETGPAAPGEPMTWPQLITRLLAVVYAVVHGNADAGQDAADHEPSSRGLDFLLRTRPRYTRGICQKAATSEHSRANIGLLGEPDPSLTRQNRPVGGVNALPLEVRGGKLAAKLSAPARPAGKSMQSPWY